MNLDELIIGNKPDFSKPVVFLDFDDVINIFDERRDHPDETVELKTIHISKGTLNPHGFPIDEGKTMHLVFDPDIVQRIRNLNAIWLTSWKQLTQTILNDVLETDFGYVDWHYRGLSDSGVYGKLSAVNEIVDTYNIQKFAVVDDSFYRGFEDVLHDAHPNCDILVIAPQFYHGLNLNEIKRLENFLRH